MIRAVIRWLPLLTLLIISSASAIAEMRLLSRHVPVALSGRKPIAPVLSTNQLSLSLGLPLRDPAGLRLFLRELSDPTSPNYRRYLTPEEFSAKWSPKEEEYSKVIAYVQSNGFRVARQHKNRMLLDVTGAAADIERTFRVRMHWYQHPTENRRCFAPDSEPSLPATLAVRDIDGLNNVHLPRRVKTGGRGTSVSVGTGRGPNGALMAADLRAAYAPGVTLDGTGQTVGLVTFDGYRPENIAAYASSNQLQHVILTNRYTDGASGIPGSSGSGAGATGEIELDIEMVMAMAPGVSRIVVYHGVDGLSGANLASHANSLLSQIAEDNQARQISTSYVWGGAVVSFFQEGEGYLGSASATTDQIFQQMAAQGQSFFCASGDWGAYWGDGKKYAFNHNDAPLLTSPYITIVGGTRLMTETGGDWASEIVWNRKVDGSGAVSSSSAVSTSYGIPSWQSGMDMESRGGSSRMRNIPDVAMVAEDVFAVMNGEARSAGGTSVSAPLWAGFMALVNQQAERHGHPPVGFINPALYKIGQGSHYTNCFHDVTSGNNTNSLSPTNFFAGSGFDLCTGWGTPTGQPLIDALSDPDALALTPRVGFTSANGPTGPFNITNKTFTLTNTRKSPLEWSLGTLPEWLSASATRGRLAGGESTRVDISLNASAELMSPGTQTATVWFTNILTGYAHQREINLKVREPLLVNGGFETGTFFGWSTLGWWYDRGDGNFTAIGKSTPLPAHSGTYYANLWPHYIVSWYNPNPYLPTYLSQKVSTVVGQTYRISWWMRAGATTGNLASECIVSWGGREIFSQVVTNSLLDAGWTNIILFANAPAEETSFEFACNGRFFLDDFSVTPEPNVAPLILNQPSPVWIAPGEAASMAVLASGAEPLVYQWRRDGVPIVDGMYLRGSISSRLDILPGGFSQRGRYDVVVSNAYGGVTSVGVSVTAVGSNILANGSFESMLLQRDTISGTPQPFWSGSTSYTVNGTPFLGSGPRGPVNFVPPLAAIMQGPVAKEGLQYMALDAVTQEVELPVAGGYILSWWDNSLIPESFSNRGLPYIVLVLDSVGSIVSSNLFDAYNLNRVHSLEWQARTLQLTMEPGRYSLLFQRSPGSSNPYPFLVDDVAIRPVLGGGEPPEFIEMPQSSTLVIGQAATFVGRGRGSEPLHYEWFFNGSRLVDGVRIAGSADRALRLNPLLPADAGPYVLVVSNLYGSITSTPAILSLVLPTLAVRYNSEDGGIIFSLDAVVGLDYQLQYTTNLMPTLWTDLGKPFKATNPVITLHEANRGDLQRFYRFRVK